MDEFSFKKDFKSVQWKETLLLNAVRSIVAGIVWGVLIFAQGQQSSADALRMPLLFPIAYFAALLPIGLLSMFLSNIGIPWVGLVSGFVALTVVVADPLVFILHKIYPALAPVEKYGFFNFNAVIFITENELLKRRNREILEDQDEETAEGPYRPLSTQKYSGVTDRTCMACKHRLPKLICGCAESSHFNRHIELTDSCKRFLKNPAQDHFARALQLANDDNCAEAVRECQHALNLGLPADDEVSTRALLGACMINIATDDIDQDRIMSQRLSEGIFQLETALTQDAQGTYGIFSKLPDRDACLGLLDSLYALRGNSIGERKGIDAQIEYLERKLRLFEYLPGVHSPDVHLALGNLYAEKGQNKRAATHWRKAQDALDLDAAVVGEDVARRRAAIKMEAKDNLTLVTS